MDRIGATEGGGVERQALTTEEARARCLLIEWARERNFECFTDAIGNLFVRRQGLSDSPPVVLGSHLDSQPKGGRFDGASGVLAAFEALEAIEDGKIPTKRPIEVVSWSNEEGARFELGCMGSQVFADPSLLKEMMEQTDKDGVSVAEALDHVRSIVPTLPMRPLGSAIDCFLELHIEQGPILEREGKSIGVVTGIQGSRKYLVEVKGEEGHAGTVPHRARKDALFAATRITTSLIDFMEDPEDIVRFTIGRMEVFPGALSVIPGFARFTIDFRHPDEAILTSKGDAVFGLCEAYAGPCTVTARETMRFPAVRFDGRLSSEIRRAVSDLKVAHMEIASGAGHDARSVAPVCDSGMIFIPCENGISHNERENIKPDDLVTGASVMALVALRMANRD